MTLVGSAMALATASCGDKFLDEMPDNRVELKTAEHLRLLLNDSYPAYNYFIPCELMSDNVVDNNSPDANGTRYNLSAYDLGDDETFAFEDVSSSTGTDTPGGIWEGYYLSIAAANSVLEKIEEFEASGYDRDDASKLPAIKAEALMLRAFCHWVLAEIFCEQYRGPELSKAIQGIPYMTKPETTVRPNYERGNLADFYENIEKDLEEGLAGIDKSLYEIPKYHFNTQAAHAFAARFYLHKRDYKKVLEHCNKAFGGEDVDVSQYMSDIWSHSGDFYYISDFGLFQQNMTKPRNFLLISTYSIAMRHLTGGRRYSMNRDAKRAAYQGPGPTWSRYSYVDKNGKEKAFSMNPAFNVSISNGRSDWGCMALHNLTEQFEYTDKHSGIGYPHVTVSEFNGEETLFMRAEAKLYLGMKQSALDDLQVWETSLRNNPGAESSNRYDDFTEARVRDFYTDPDLGYGIVKPLNIDELYPCEYSVNDDIEPLLQCMLHFRRIQTVHTGMRFFDLKRYAIEYSHVIGKEARVETLTKFDKRRAIQIPYEALQGGMQPTYRDENLEKARPESGYVMVSQ